MTLSPNGKWRLLPGSEVYREYPPQHLTAEEIEYVLDGFPIVQAADPEAGNLARSEILDNLRAQLSDVELVPIREVLDKLKRDIVQHYKSSLVQQGEAVSTAAADALGSSVTQMTLNTFKEAGVGQTIGSGVKGMKNLVYAVANRTDAKTIVHFLLPVNHRDIIDMRSIVVESKVSDFITESDIYPIHLDPDSLEESSLTLYWWHDAYAKVTGNTLSDSTYAMRLKLDKVKMYERRVTMQDLVKTIEDPGILYCVCSPFNITDDAGNPLSYAIIDIFPSDTNVRLQMAMAAHVELPEIAKLYLVTIVEPSFTSRRVKGIPGIKNMIPIEQRTTALIVDPRQISDPEFDSMLFSDGVSITPEQLMKTIDPTATVDVATLRSRLWRIDINRRIMRVTGIKVENVIKLMLMSGVTIVNTLNNKHGEYSAFYCYTSSGRTPNDIVNSFVKDNEADDEVTKLAVYTYAVTEGSDMEAILKIPWVDKTRTISNNMFRTAEYFGIETSRTSVLNEVVQVMAGSGIMLNSRHLTLITDFMFGRGIPLGITHSGITKQKEGFVTMSAVERAMQEFRNAAPYNKTESTDSFAASIVVGMTPKIGSNSGALFGDKEYIQRLKERLQRKKDAPRGKRVKVHPIQAGEAIVKASNLSSVAVELTEVAEGAKLSLSLGPAPAAESRVRVPVLQPGEAEFPVRKARAPQPEILSSTLIDAIHSIAANARELPLVPKESAQGPVIQTLAPEIEMEVKGDYQYPSPFVGYQPVQRFTALPVGIMELLA